MDRVEDVNKVNHYIHEMYSQKPLFTNYFNNIITENDFYIKTTSSLILIKLFDKYSRIYLMSNNREEIIELLSSIDGFNVINIPSKNNIELFDSLMYDASYKRIKVYERFFNQNIIQRSNLDLIQYASIENLDEIFELLYSNFIPYQDYLPSYLELKLFIERKQVIVNQLDDKILGAFVFQDENRKCYLRAWIDKSSNGMKLLFDVYSLMKQKGISYAYFWADSENKKVISIHKLLGAKPDGLKDYIYIMNN